MYLTKTFEVRAPIERVYDYLSDPRNAVRPMADATVTVERVSSDDGEPTQRFLMSVSIPSGETASYEMLYEELEAPRHIAATVVGQMKGQANIGSTRVTYDLASVVGGTRVVERGEFHPGFVKAVLLYLARVTGAWRRRSRPAGAAMAKAIEAWASSRPASTQDAES
jgi:uncharacterized protein YndB with AHSA1/START domain